MRSRNPLPSPFSPKIFHLVRTINFISTLIVSVIMIYFTIHLHRDGFRLPWAFLVLMIACALTLLNITFTTCLYFCSSLSPLLSLTFDFCLLILWGIAFGMLTHGMRDTLTTTCDSNDWGTATGIMICRIYKVLFTFSLLATLSQFLQVVVDVAARRRQYRAGDVYNAMPGNGRGEDIKLHQRGDSTFSTTSSHDPYTDAYNALGTVRHPQHHQQPPREQQGPLHTPYDNVGTTVSPYTDDNLHHRGYRAGGGDAYEDIPDLPPESITYSRAPPAYSPLRSRTDDHPAYEPYRGQVPTHYDPGMYR
ncbi:hypothetical protein VTN31DRAFT_2466 [Thermomyces dupontii]|uniref:uncharacterized protein n=1 Tax=Talaromyces thermophilus TaxID=28565 RepID=UPI003742CB11